MSEGAMANDRAGRAVLDFKRVAIGGGHVLEERLFSENDGPGVKNRFRITVDVNAPHGHKLRRITDHSGGYVMNVSVFNQARALCADAEGGAGRNVRVADHFRMAHGEK